MFQKLRNNIFAVNKSLHITASKFNHCSTVCGHKDGALVAWYSGSGECKDDQSVHVIFIDKSSKADTENSLRIGDCTGNPVLWTHGTEAVLLWSKFEDTGNTQRIVDRWKYCSLWIQRLTYTNKIEMLGDPVKIAGPNQHLLGRCGPITTKKGYFLLPLYDELHGECVIFGGSDLQFEERSRYGTRMIQPTLWEHTANGETKLCSLSRNFSSTGKKSFYCESTNDGVMWSEPIPSDLHNRNNSLHVLNWNDENVVLWNNSTSRYRDKMTFGIISQESSHAGIQDIQAKPVKMVGPKYGAYPAMCTDTNGNIHFTFTNADRAIEYHTWNSKFFRSERRRDTD